MNLFRFWVTGFLVAFASAFTVQQAQAAPLYYSGNTDSVNALANVSNGAYGTAAFVSNGFTVPVTPGTIGWQVTGLFTNNILDYAAGSAEWSIRSGVSAGNPGTVIASGTAAVTPVLTGNNLFGLGEYTVTVSGLDIFLAPGTYTFQVTPVGQGGNLGFGAQTSTAGAGAIGTSSASFFTDVDSLINFDPSTSQGAEFGALSGGVLGNVVIPEPTTLALLGVGLLAVVVRRGRRVAV